MSGTEQLETLAPKAIHFFTKSGESPLGLGRLARTRLTA